MMAPRNTGRTKGAGMLHRDYLVEQFIRFADAIRISLAKARGDSPDPLAAADQLEAAVGSATSIDGATLLLLSPESIASILQVTDTDPDIVEYLARTLLLESQFLMEGGDEFRSRLREQQAQAIARGYGIGLSAQMVTEDELEALFDRTQRRGE